MPDLPIIDILIHPWIKLLHESAPLAPATGSGTLTRPITPVLPLTYGLSFSFFTVPVEFGHTVGVLNVYHNRMVQLAAEYPLSVGGTVFAQLEDHYAEGIYIWKEPLPDTIHYAIAPGVTVIFSWLQS